MHRLVSASARGTRSAAIALAGGSARRPCLSSSATSKMASSSIGQRSTTSSSLASSSPLAKRRPARWAVTRASSSSVGGRSGGGGSIGGSGGGSGGGGGGGGFGGSSDDSFFAKLAALWPAYLSLLSEKPLPTKSATAAVLNAAGDACAQLLIEKKKVFGGGTGNKNEQFDYARLGRFTLLGGVLVGPALHHWYGTLARVVTLQGTSGALARLALDQLAFAPVFIGSFFASLGVLEGKNLKQISDKLRSDLPGTVQSNWILWVPANFVNFRFVPVPLQVAFSNFVALFWNTYVSFVSNRP